jgi:serine/threonine protein kinase
VGSGFSEEAPREGEGAKGDEAPTKTSTKSPKTVSPTTQSDEQPRIPDHEPHSTLLEPAVLTTGYVQDMSLSDALQGIAGSKLDQQSAAFQGLRISKVLGCGLHAVVVEAENKENRTMAIKISRPDRDSCLAVHRHGEMLVMCEHSRVVCNLLSFEATIGGSVRQCVAMSSHADGDCLRYVQMLFERDRRVIESILVMWIYDVLKALAYIHSLGVVHGSVTPDNCPSSILVASDASVLLNADFHGVVLTGFGSSFHSKSPFSSRKNYFDPPEVLELDQQRSAKADIWALGCSCVLMSVPWNILDDLGLTNAPAKLNEADRAAHGQIIKDLGYSEDLAKLVRVMTMDNSEKRPSASQLLTLPIFKGILEESQDRMVTTSGTVTEDMVVVPRSERIKQIRQSLTKQNSMLSRDARKSVGLAVIVFRGSDLSMLSINASATLELSITQNDVDIGENLCDCVSEDDVTKLRGAVAQCEEGLPVAQATITFISKIGKVVEKVVSISKTNNDQYTMYLDA